MRKLDTKLTTPEERIVRQGDTVSPDSTAMYFIAQGDCTVDILDPNGATHTAIRVLIEGDHFGEVSLLYQCKRTASVNARGFNTMAGLNIRRYREICNQYPPFADALLREVRSRRDPM